ncbi:MAG TPA: polymer-forming cytoskeletal protein [Thermoanaerobaculia bacterium]|nr:polymer-forming cytoskeletal protein [Thermoanaerobaculia bacterium]
MRRTDRPPATVGPSIFIKGDLSGEEDLVIEGRVEGKVDLKQHNVTIGKNGRVRADVFGRTVIVEGEVDGNLFAQEQAILRQSGAVRGNITAPRVMLEDGSRFRGSIDMESKETPKPAAAVPATASPSPTSPPSPPSPPSPSSPTSPGSPASPAIGPAAAGPPPPAANTEVGAAVAASRSS